jgi:hypothetical protein
MLSEAIGNPVELSSSTPIGTYVVVCEGGSGFGYYLDEYLDGEFVVERYKRGLPNDYLERLLAGETAVLPNTL